MDFLSNNLIFAVFIGIAIVSQIGRLLIRRAEKRKRGESRERTEERQEAAVQSSYEYGEDAEDEDEAFSAWALSVDDESALPAAALPVSPAAVPFSTPLSVPLSASSSFPALIANSALGAEKYGAEGPFPPSAPEEAGPSIDGNGRGKTRSNAGLKRSAVSAGFPEKLDYLPPLKRAVVLAEILGPPKGF
jgi:hypothetical protein